MTEKKRIGLREVRALKSGETIWDAAVTGFHARRQQGVAVTYSVFYRTKEGRQRWQKIGRHGASGHRIRRARKPSKFSACCRRRRSCAAEKRNIAQRNDGCRTVRCVPRRRSDWARPNAEQRAEEA